MKLIYILIAIAICAGGCKKFLEESPYSFVSTENFYKTAADAELALTGVYDILNATTVQGQGNNNMWSRGMQFMTSTGCDELIGDPTKNNSDNNYITIANYTYTGENALVQNAYAFMYAGINRANYIIEKVPGIAMDAVRREQIIGEARLLKGVFYFYLGWLYGGVPLVNSTSVDLKAPRNSLEIVMKQAESDLQFAYQKLPARNSQAGRVNKYTAEGFLIKLYTYLASCRENNVGEALNFPLNSFAWVDKTAMYDQALQLCADMYTQSGYTLIRPYAHLFLAATEELARNEHLFVVQASATEYIYYFNLAGPTGNYLTVGGTAGWLRPVREGYTRLNANDGRRASFSGNIASAGAPSTVINGFKYYTPVAVASNLSNICVNKWRECDPNDRIARGIPANSGETDWGVLRYADILLLYAECKFKTGDLAGARALLREVRLRACADDVTKTNTITTAYFKTDFMQELLDERSRELLGEGWRRFDLIRTGKLQAVVAALDPSVMFANEDVATVKANFADYKIWYPIPKREMETNNNLVPNPGYE